MLFRAEFTNGTKPVLKVIKGDSFTCRFCDKSFKFKFSLILHLKKKHGQISKDKINWNPNVVLFKVVTNHFECHKCKAGFVTHDKLLTHVSLVHKDHQSTLTNQYDCHVCDAGFVTHKKLLTHVAKAHYNERVLSFFGKKKHECGVCNLVSIFHSNLSNQKTRTFFTIFYYFSWSKKLSSFLGIVSIKLEW